MKKPAIRFALLIALAAACAGVASRSLVSARHTPQESRSVSVPAGSRILVRTADAIDSNKDRAGQRFTGTLETNLQVEDTVAAPRGTTVHGRVINAKAAGRMAGGAELSLELTDIIMNGNAVPIVTGSYELRSTGRGEQTAGRTVAGAGLGALIGSIAGGGRGAGVGAVAGVGAGAAASAVNGAQQLSIPTESLLEFRLQHPVSLTPAE
jgi:hypothetical protein